MDVTERNENSLAAGRDVNQGLFFLEPDGRIVQMNASAEELSGYVFSEIRGWSLWDLIEKSKVPAPRQSYTYTLRPKDGEPIPVHLRFTPLLEDSQIQLVLLQDLRDSEDRDQALHIQQTKLNALLEAIPDHIFIQDYQGYFLDYYPPAEKPIFPLDTKVEGTHMSDWFPPTLCQQFIEAFIQIQVDWGTRLIEFRMDQGRESYFEARLVPMNDQKILSIVREVTEEKMLENVLHLRNRALEAAGNGIVIADAKHPDTPLLYANPAFIEITGYPYSEIVGRNCRFLQGEDRDQPGLDRVRKALSKKEASQEIIRNYKKDGSLFWNELTITPIRDAHGEVSHFIGVIKDVTENIQESERKDRIRDLLQAIGEDQPLEEIARGLCHLLVNQMGEGGALISILHDKTLSALAHWGLTPAMEEAFSTLDLDTRSFCPCEQAAKSKHERIIPDLSKDDSWKERMTLYEEAGIQSCWSLPIFSSQKEVLGTCTLFRSTSGDPDPEMKGLIQEVIQLGGVAIERDRNQQQLKASKAQLEAYTRTLEENVEARTQEVQDTFEKLVETNINLKDQIETAREAENRATVNQQLFAAIARDFPKGVIMVLGQDLEFIHLEGEEIHALGLAEWDYSEQTIDALPGLSRPQTDLLIAKVKQTLEGAHLSFELEHSGQVYVVNSSPLSLKESENWALLVFSNSTEQKRTEQELVRALRIEQELNDLKSRFISMASHEFRTPLSAIMSSAILIGKQNNEKAAQKRERYVRQIKNNVRNLVVILDDFLSLGKLEAGNLGPQPSRFDLLALLRSVLEELESSLKIGQHFVEDCNIADTTLYQDPKFVRQTLVNLLSNAIKYSPENSIIHIGVKGDTEVIQLLIRDTGMGIPEEEQPQVFNRFFRARNAVNIPGTGLGLHIVKQYTELMGGEIRFESQSGEGTSFIVRLPRQFNQ